MVSEKAVEERPLKIIRPPAFSVSTAVAGAAALAGHLDLLYTLTLFRLDVRYKQSILGWMWAVLQPLALMILYTLIFSRLARLESEGLPYSLFVLAALLPWIFFASAVSNSVNGFIGHSALITRMYFPREIITLSYVAAAFVDLGVAFIILTILMVYHKVPWTWRILYTLPILAMLCAFTAAVALLLSSIQVKFRDIGVALPLLLQITMFATPVVYPLRSVPARFRLLYLSNPVASLIESFRRVVLLGKDPDLHMMMSASALSIVALALAYVYFKTKEPTMADMI
jgi:lipopolysaccharide transport system permease protein